MKMARLTSTRVLVVTAIVAGGLAAALITVSVTKSGSSSSSPPQAVAISGAADTSRMLAGIPQRGNVLGNASAPVTLVEYADIQCPYCGVWARDALPTLVDSYVRPGKVKLVFHGLAFVGPDSEPALRTALAAGAQNRLWNVVDLLFRNQGEENRGWVTEDLLSSIGQAVPGLDAQRMLDERNAGSTTAAVAADARAAQDAGVNSTPAFQAGLSGGQMEALTVDSLEASAFRPALDQLLAS